MSITTDRVNVDSLLLILDRTLFDPSFLLVPLLAIVFRDGYRLSSPLASWSLGYWLLVFATRLYVFPLNHT